MPHDAAGQLVERDKSSIELRDEHLAVGERDAAVVPAATRSVDGLLDVGLVRPDPRAGRGVNREYVVIARGDVHRAGRFAFDDIG